MRILISAGEASGEMYGAQLMQALRAEVIRVGTGAPARPAERSSATSPQQLEFFGVGGDKMRAAGCDIVVDAKDLSVVGITEILSHLPKIWGLFHKLIAEADRRKSDLAIVIDSPAFNWRVARQMKKRGIPVVYYVCLSSGPGVRAGFVYSGSMWTKLWSFFPSKKSSIAIAE